MSSILFTAEELAMIVRLLAEVQPIEADRDSAIVTTQARLLAAAFEGGMTGERDLRQLLTEHIKLNDALGGSRRRWENEALASLHRQEHMLASPERPSRNSGVWGVDGRLQM